MATEPAGRTYRLLDDNQRMIIDRSCSVLSLDIFDTVQCRRVPRPTDMLAAQRAREATALTDEGERPRALLSRRLRPRLSAARPHVGQTACGAPAEGRRKQMAK